MAKFGNPLGQGTELFITQTYHNTAGNTAIDISSLANKPVYAIADGKILHTDTKLGSYCSTSITGSNLGSLFYVHTYKWLPVGTSFKKGDKICEIAPTSLNGNNPTHLHLGLPTGNYIMDYMDRSIIFRAGFTWGSKDNLAIRNAWFNGGSELNWALFKDLSYNDNTMSYKIGDVIEFTGTQNIRQGSGTSYPSTGSTQIGQTATIINGPRTSDNYTWWDVKITGGGTGWLADVGKWKIYVEPPQEPTTPPELVECQSRVKSLEKEIGTLESKLGACEGSRSELVVQKGELEAKANAFELEASQLKSEVSQLEAEVSQLRAEIKKQEEIEKTLDEEVRTWIESYDALYATHNRVVKEKNEAIEELRQERLKECGPFEGIKLLFNKLLKLIRRLGKS